MHRNGRTLLRPLSSVTEISVFEVTPAIDVDCVSIKRSAFVERYTDGVSDLVEGRVLLEGTISEVSGRDEREKVSLDCPLMVKIAES